MVDKIWIIVSSVNKLEERCVLLNCDPPDTIQIEETIYERVSSMKYQCVFDLTVRNNLKIPNRMILILRGHIRNSMDNNTLLNTLKLIVEKIPDIIIYIHAWNVISSSISWREIPENNMKVTSEYILNYFNDIRANIQHIEISDDTSIELIGNTSGKVGYSRMPKIGWKRMWYGKYKILSIIKSKITNTKTIIINMRFDIHTVKDFYQDKIKILTFIEKIYSSQNCDIEFQKDNLGCDNLYSGSLANMYLLTNDFHKNLDDIEYRLPDSIHQEVYVKRNAVYLKFLNLFEF